MSSSEQDRVRELAERVARRLGRRAARAQSGAEGGELAAVRASLAEIQRRLAHIESHITHGEDCGARRAPVERSPFSVNFIFNFPTQNTLQPRRARRG